MMTKDQYDTVQKVYRNFQHSDQLDTKWTDLDEQMSMLDWLEDPQIVIEAAVIHQLQAQGQPRCTQDHPVSECFVPVIHEAIGFILDLYSETENLHVKNRFILQYYLALTQSGFILS